MEANKTVGKCKHCDDPIYDFQVVAHEGCARDAVVEALKENCDVLAGYSDFGEKELWEAFTRKANNKSGYLLFIPDEAEEYKRATTVEFTADDIIN